MLRVAKFGGSSVASAEQFKKVKEIVKMDPTRKFVVVSAVGKANKEDKMVVAFRKKKISVEESYQMLRHWFAPLGQDKLEVIGTNESNDGEKQTKVLETYQEFAEWTHLERDW